MKFPHSVILGCLLSGLFPSWTAYAGDRETISFGRTPPSAGQVETFLFPEAQCESAKYQCMSVRPNTERSIGMDVRFQIGSAELTSEAKVQLKGWGEALATRRGKLNPGEIVIEGHTDATGSAELNKALSERRAESVRKHLVSTYGIDPKALKPVGRGEERLKDAARPGSEINRRVELVRTAN